MKLSTAIRDGARKRPQAFGRWYDIRDGVPHTDVMGAAFEGAGESFDVDHPGDTRKMMARLFPLFGSYKARPCPAKDRVTQYDIYLMCQHLNDRHRWARESIARWVTQFETANV
jgi:hypothetical protein